MNRTVTSMAILLTMILFSGCYGKISSSMSMSSTTVGGDSVSNQDGKGIGNVAGIDIEVAGLTDGAAGISVGASGSEGPGGSTMSETWDIDFGEVKIAFKRENEGPVLVQVDGADYGELNKGDRLFIDESRSVFVNDVKQTPQ